MNNKLYVGNLSYSVRDDDLQQHFSAFGNVQSAKVMMERDTGRSKGFGFVEMSTAQEAQAAIDGLNGKNMGGRDLTVNIARPMESRPRVTTPAVTAADVATTDPPLEQQWAASGLRGSPFFMLDRRGHDPPGRRRLISIACRARICLTAPH